jgi:hypothetical protein
VLATYVCGCRHEDPLASTHGSRRAYDGQRQHCTLYWDSHVNLWRSHSIRGRDSNVGEMGIEHHYKRRRINEYKRASCLCMACMAVGRL